MKNYLFLVIIACTLSLQAVKDELTYEPYSDNWQKSELFDTQKLRDVPKMRELLLKNYGFKHSSFKSTDGLKLECLQRFVENAPCTFICHTGYFPGNMEGAASLIKMFPKECNILFVNNRGIGGSEKRPWYSLQQFWTYGSEEYNDLLGALNHVNNLNNGQKKPIMIHSFCSGSMNTAIALNYLHKNNQLSKYNIAGIFFDSAVSHLPTAIENIPQYVTAKLNTIKRLVYTLFLWSLRYTIFAPRFMTSGEHACIDTQTLAQTNIPTHHFYCEKGDLFTPYSMTHKLYEEHYKAAPEKFNYYITKTIFDQSSHTSHLLKHPEFYAKEMQNVITTWMKRQKSNI